MKTSSYRISGLCCAEEAAALRGELGQLPGVAALEFDVLNARMAVTFDPDRIAEAGIVAAVAATGMKATPWEERGLSGDAPPFWERQGRLLLVCVSGAFLVLGLLSHWALHGSLGDALFGGLEGEHHVPPLPSLLLFVASTVAGAWFIVPRGWHSLRRLRPDMNLLMTVAAAGAMLIGEWFEAATVSFLFAVALLLEQWSLGRARRAVAALMELAPATARTLCPDDGDIEELAIEDVAVGATVVVRPGERIPLDGVVTGGSTSVNQAPITGESVPVSKRPGDEVYAGTINEDGAIEYRSTKAAGDTTLARIVHMVAEAQSRRAPSQQFVERFAVYYTPLMMALSLAMMVGPPLLLGGSWGAWFYRGLVILVIACPCALVISTPVSIVSALASAARSGVLIKGGAFLEAAGNLRAVALDKTGTLTVGHPEVQQIVPLNGHSAAELLERAAALEANSDHPLARAVLRRAGAEGVEVARAQDFVALQGKGAEGTLDGRRFWIGSHRYMHEKGMCDEDLHDDAERYEDAGHSVVVVGNDAHVCGLITVADAAREGTAGAIADLRRLGIQRVVMLTGDNGGTAAAVAAQVGLDEIRAELLPQDKVAAVEELKAGAGVTAMVGDGVNDAPAMAAASFGIAMGTIGTDTAIETADIAFMSDDLAKLPWLVEHSRRTVRIIHQNIIFALGLKLCFVILALAGRSSLWMAIAADMGASLLVISNGLRLLGARGKPSP